MSGGNASAPPTKLPAFWRLLHVFPWKLTRQTWGPRIVRIHKSELWVTLLFTAILIKCLLFALCLLNSSTGFSKLISSRSRKPYLTDQSEKWGYTFPTPYIWYTRRYTEGVLCRIHEFRELYNEMIQVSCDPSASIVGQSFNHMRAIMIVRDDVGVSYIAIIQCSHNVYLLVNIC